MMMEQQALPQQCHSRSHHLGPIALTVVSILGARSGVIDNCDKLAGSEPNGWKVQTCILATEPCRQTPLFAVLKLKTCHPGAATFDKNGDMDIWAKLLIKSTFMDWIATRALYQAWPWILSPQVHCRHFYHIAHRYGGSICRNTPKLQYCSTVVQSMICQRSLCFQLKGQTYS